MGRQWATAQLSAITVALFSMGAAASWDLTDEDRSSTKFDVRDDACSVFSSSCSKPATEQQEQSEYTAMNIELAQMKMSRKKKLDSPSKHIDETDEDTTGVVTELPSEWRDKAQLSSLYHDLMIDDAWIPPTQKQLAQAMKQCDTFQKENRVGLTGEYKKWRAGEVPSYRDYTGWCAYPDKYIALLSTLYEMGLGEQSMVLEIGCGALSLGRLLIPFLARGHYHCIEPSRELIQDGIKFELGYDMLQRKLPSFAINAEFIAPPGLPESLVGSDAKATTERTTYDFMIANSIFTHTADDLFTTAMTNLRPRFASNARMLATIIFENWCGNLNHSQSLSSEASGWVYDRPFFVCHSPDHLTELLRAHGLAWEFAEQAGHQQFQAEVLIYPQGP